MNTTVPLDARPVSALARGPIVRLATSASPVSSHSACFTPGMIGGPVCASNSGYGGPDDAAPANALAEATTPTSIQRLERVCKVIAES